MVSHFPFLLCICSYLLKSILWRGWLKCLEFIVRKAVIQPISMNITGFLGRSLDVSMTRISGETLVLNSLTSLPLFASYSSLFLHIGFCVGNNNQLKFRKPFFSWNVYVLYLKIGLSIEC